MKIVTNQSSVNDIVDHLGITRIGDNRIEEVYWEYNGVRILRPTFKACWKSVKENFGIDSDLLKFEDGYYK
jgi:hypothetical protein